MFLGGKQSVFFLRLAYFALCEAFLGSVEVHKVKTEQEFGVHFDSFGQ